MEELKATAELISQFGGLVVLAGLGVYWKLNADKERRSREAQDAQRVKDEAQALRSHQIAVMEAEERARASADARKREEKIQLLADVTKREIAMEAMAQGFASRVEALQKSHRDEIKELTDRFVALVQDYGKNYRELVERSLSVTEAMSRASRR